MKAIKAVEFHGAHTWEPNPENCVPYDGYEAYTVLIAADHADEYQKENPNETRGKEVEVSTDEFTIYEGYVMTHKDAEFEKDMAEFLEQNTTKEEQEYYEQLEKEMKEQRETK